MPDVPTLLSPARGCHLLAVGTYTDPLPHVHGRGRGIHLLEFDTATASFREGQTLPGPANPSYLCAAPGRLYGISEHGCASTLNVYAVEAGGLRPIGCARVPGADPCHVSVNLAARQLYVSNYSSGELLCYALDSRGLPQGSPQTVERSGTGPRVVRQAGPHLHYAAASADGSRVYLCDLGTDTVGCHRVLRTGLAPEPAWEMRSPPGSGPRHLALSADGSFAAVVEELSNSVALLKLDGTASVLDRASTLPPGWYGANAASAIRLHPNGEWLYVSNRGHDSIAAYRLRGSPSRLDPIGWISVGGRAPRDITVTPDGTFLLVASQDDHFLRALRIDPATGMPESAGAPHPLRSPACLCILP